MEVVVVVGAVASIVSGGPGMEAVVVVGAAAYIVSGGPSIHW
jgi:hypothetical protein